jgi:hypothetical protein
MKPCRFGDRVLFLKANRSLIGAGRRNAARFSCPGLTRVNTRTTTV